MIRTTDKSIRAHFDTFGRNSLVLMHLCISAFDGLENIEECGIHSVQYVIIYFAIFDLDSMANKCTQK